MEGTNYVSSILKQENNNIISHPNNFLAFSRETNSPKSPVVSSPREDDNEIKGRERLKKYREEMGGQIIIPDCWGQEDFLKDWSDCSSFGKSLPNVATIASARQALVVDQANDSHHQSLRIQINKLDTCLLS